MKHAARATANIGFILLFPGFFFWHMGLAMGFNPIRIGLYGQVSAVLAAAFVTALLLPSIARIAKSVFAATASGFFMFCLLWIVVQSTASPPPGSLNQALAGVVAWIALFFVGLFMDIEDRAFRSVLAVSLAAMVALTIAHLDGLHFIAHQLSDDDEGIASYQGFSRSAMLTAVVLLSLTKSAWKRISFPTLSIFFVFILAARSELYALIFVVAIVEGVYTIKYPRRFFMLSTVVLVLLAAVVWNIDTLSSSRQLQVLNLSEASSWVARQEFTAFAWAQIVDSPLLGFFGGHYFASDTGTLGGYAHNSLSVWVTFGLMGFILYMSLTIWATVVSLIMAYRFEVAQWRLSLYLNASALILVIVAKSVFWPVVALGWGVFAAQSIMSSNMKQTHIARRLITSPAH